MEGENQPEDNNNLVIPEVLSEEEWDAQNGRDSDDDEVPQPLSMEG